MSTSTIGSYVLSLKEKSASAAADTQLASARVLKVFGSSTCSFGQLISKTGLPEDLLRSIIEDLRQRQLIEGEDEKLSLTPLGYKAQLIVAT
jgi:hypothetical protein